MNILVTGGCGFIGSQMVRYLLEGTTHLVVNVDSLSYAGTKANLSSVAGYRRYHFYHNDICDQEGMLRILRRHAINAVMHFAAETHVDRSIKASDPFIQTNVVGTQKLLEAVRIYLTDTDTVCARSDFRWLQVSTDEVFGDRGSEERASKESDGYAPSSPYSASKAAADHIVRAYERTHRIPSIITYACNNYGPNQYPEKLIPLTVDRVLCGQTVPVYGSGDQVREWIYVEDHVRGLYAALTQGRVGESYNLGSGVRLQNLELVLAICDLLDVFASKNGIGLSEKCARSLIQHVPDRLGHDSRYAIDSSKARAELDWKPLDSFEEALKRTVIGLAEKFTWESSGNPIAKTRAYA